MRTRPYCRKREGELVRKIEQLRRSLETAVTELGHAETELGEIRRRRAA